MGQSKLILRFVKYFQNLFFKPTWTDTTRKCIIFFKLLYRNLFMLSLKSCVERQKQSI